MFKQCLLILILFFNLSNANSNEKTAFIDIDYVLNNSFLGKSILNELEKINKKNLQDLKLKEKTINEKKENINKTKNIIKKEKLEKEIELFNQYVEKYKIEKNQFSKEFRQKKQNDLENFLKKISPIIENYMKTYSIDIVLEKKQLFIGNSNNDITNDILELVNKKFNE